MKLALEKYGINLPSFGKIGGILANQVNLMFSMFIYIQYESKKRFHYRAVPFQRTVITVRFVCRFWRRYRSVLPSESFGSVSFRLCALTVPAEIVE